MKFNRFYFFSICLLAILLFKALPVYAGALICPPCANPNQGLNSICHTTDTIICQNCTNAQTSLDAGRCCGPGDQPPGTACTCQPPPVVIPTLNQWGMIIMAGVLALFAVIGLFVMRRSGVVRPSN